MRTDEQLPPADEGRRSSEGLGLAPMEQLLAFVDWERKNNPGHKHVAEWAAEEIERCHSRIAAIEAWQMRGETLLETHSFTIAFNLGAWWADRPWRKRPNV